VEKACVKVSKEFNCYVTLLETITSSFKTALWCVEESELYKDFKFKKGRSVWRDILCCTQTGLAHQKDSM